MADIISFCRGMGHQVTIASGLKKIKIVTLLPGESLFTSTAMTDKEHMRWYILRDKEFRRMNIKKKTKSPPPPTTTEFIFS